MTIIAIIKPFCCALLSITIFSFVVYSMFCENALRLNDDIQMQQLAVK